MGYSYPETSAGSSQLVNYDVTSYSIPIPVGTTSPISVTATLRYQTTSKDYVEFLRDEALTNGFPADCIVCNSGFPTESRGEILFGMWNDHGKSAPDDVVTASGVVPVPEPSVSTMLVFGSICLSILFRIGRDRDTFA